MALSQRDITLDVTIRARTAEADRAAASLKQIDERAAHAGKSMEGMSGDAHILNAEIKKSEQTIKDLDKVLLEFGNDKSVRQRIRGERSWLADLKRIERDLAGAASNINVTNNFGSQLAESIKGAPIGPILITTLVGAAVAAAPTIGAMLGGAVAGAAGTGAMAIGILSAIKDEGVRSAAQKAGQSIASDFFAGGQAFVEPTKDAIAILQHGFEDIHLSDSLAKMAPTVTVIAQGLADAAREFMPGFNKALDRMGPLADVAGKGLADTGEALGEMLDNITASKGTVEGLETLFSVLTGTVRGLGVGIRWLGDRFHEWDVIQAHVFGALEDIPILPDAVRGGYARLNDIFERMTGTGENLHGVFSRLGADAEKDPFPEYLHKVWAELDRVKQESEAAAKGIEDFWNQIRTAEDANISWERALDNLTEGIKENGRSLDITNEKGRRNVENVEAAIQAAQQQYAANIKAGMSAQEAGRRFADEVKHIEDVGTAAGLSRKQLEELAGKYLISVAVVGATSIANAILNAYYGRGGTATVVSTGRPARESFAKGGTTPAFAPFEVHDGEMLFSSQPHYMATKSQVDALRGGGDGASANITVAFAATGDSLLDAILKQLRPYIRHNGGTGSDSVQVALGY